MHCALITLRKIRTYMAGSVTSSNLLSITKVLYTRVIAVKLIRIGFCPIQI
jgi:hypothetical protein